MDSRPATGAEAGAVARCITLAFATDPVWEPALRRSDGRTDHCEPYWRLFVDGAMGYGTVRVTAGLEAVAVWLPPGGTELTEGLQAALDALLASALDDEARAAMATLYERFEASRAPHPEHYYLSLLATDPEHRGRGIGQSLLAADLRRWDAAGAPAYLESTNPGNDHRYGRAGFQAIGGFHAVRDDAGSPRCGGRPVARRPCRRSVVPSISPVVASEGSRQDRPGRRSTRAADPARGASGRDPRHPPRRTRPRGASGHDSRIPPP